MIQMNGMNIMLENLLIASIENTCDFNTMRMKVRKRKEKNGRKFSDADPSLGMKIMDITFLTFLPVS